MPFETLESDPLGNRQQAKKYHICVCVCAATPTRNDTHSLKDTDTREWEILASTLRNAFDTDICTAHCMFAKQSIFVPQTFEVFIVCVFDGFTRFASFVSISFFVSLPLPFNVYSVLFLFVSLYFVTVARSWAKSNEPKIGVVGCTPHRLKSIFTTISLSWVWLNAIVCILLGARPTCWFHFDSFSMIRSPSNQLPFNTVFFSLLHCEERKKNQPEFVHRWGSFSIVHIKHI